MIIGRAIIRFFIIAFWLLALVAVMYFSSLGFLNGEKMSINVCTWPALFDMQLVTQFEKQTGIRVNMSYYDSNEELFLKLGNKKNHGYDLIIPSDYAVYNLRKRGLLKTIDKKKVFFFSQINPLFLAHYFDKRNDYSLPYEWSVYVLGINKKCFPQSAVPQPIPESWSLIFDKNAEDRAEDRPDIVMTNDPLLGVPIAAYYLYGSLDVLTKSHINKIQHLLSCQYKRVVVYSDFRPSYYLASYNACVAVSACSYILKAMQKDPHIDFVIPREGTMLTIESFAIPSTSTKDDLVYAFMNYMMEPKHVAISQEKAGFLPVTKDVLEYIQVHPKALSLLRMSKEEFSRFHLLKVDKLKAAISDRELQDLWIGIKV